MEQPDVDITCFPSNKSCCQELQLGTKFGVTGVEEGSMISAPCFGNVADVDSDKLELMTSDFMTAQEMFYGKSLDTGKAYC